MSRKRQPMRRRLASNCWRERAGKAMRMAKKMQVRRPAAAITVLKFMAVVCLILLIRLTASMTSGPIDSGLLESGLP